MMLVLYLKNYKTFYRDIVAEVEGQATHSKL